MKYFITIIFMILGTVLSAEELILGEDGLYKPNWMNETFLDLNEDLKDAIDQDKILFVVFEQRGCIYCKIMHKEVFSDPDIAPILKNKFYGIQINIRGDKSVTDLDGEVLPEKKASNKWGAVLTPTLFFVKNFDGDNLKEATAFEFPGAMKKDNFLKILDWVQEFE